MKRHDSLEMSPSDSDSESVNRLLQFLAKEGEHADKHQKCHWISWLFIINLILKQPLKGKSVCETHSWHPLTLA